VVNADGSDPHELTNAPGQWVESDLLWSPDGSQIAFNRWNQVGTEWPISPIGVVSTTGGEVRSVGPVPVPEGAAFTWSPDGTTIISVDGKVTDWAPMDLVKEKQPLLINVATGSVSEATWSMSSWPAWQRLAVED
jgi:Tol biopolymer transport system component